MVISDARQLIYLKTWKTASTSTARRRTSLGVVELKRR